MQHSRVEREIVILALFVYGSTAALGDQVALTPVADTTLYESATGAVANGAGTAMFAGRNSGASNTFRRGLLRFDFSAIPAGSIVTGVSLSLNNSATNLGAATVGLHVVSNSWGEGASMAVGGQGGGIASQPGDATWIHRLFPGTLWASAGGDFAAAASATKSVGGAGFYDWSSPAMVADVQSFLDSPANNFGWLLRGDEVTAGSAKRFATREEPNAALRPALTVTYQIPAPAGLGIFAGIGVLSLRRRRF